MYPIPSPPATVAVIFFVAVFFSVHVTTPFSVSADCNTTFSCGSLQNLSYPFTGGNHPEYCGPPEFRLSCSGRESPEITINSLKYRVLRVDQLQHTLTLARSDLWNETCPKKFVNTSLDSRVFSYGVGNTNLTMLYRCNVSLYSLTPENRIWCVNFGIPSNDSYFLVGPIPYDPALRVIQCNTSIGVPILESIAFNLTQNRSLLGEALMLGFNVNYTIPFSDLCSKCLGSGGQCEFDSNSSKPICICGDQVCSVSRGGSSQTSKVVGISIAGACILGILIGGSGYYFCIQKKKKRAALIQTKGLITPPSSKSMITSSTNFSRSTHSGSYTYSQSDLEKCSTYFGAQVFSYTELEEGTDNFDPSRQLGEGGFGVVYYGVLRDGRVVAVKRLYETNFKRVEQFKNEVEILSRLEHKNLVKLYGCTSRRSRELILVYEFIPNGTVADHLHGKQTNSSVLRWPVRLSIAIETADALAYLHRSDIIHRDVKTNNILLDNQFRVKVADFGLSRLFPNDVTHVSTAPQGTPGYVDPEYYQSYQLTDKSDVYSFGVVLIELISSLQAVDTNRHRHDINLANMAVTRIQNHAVNELVDPCLGFESDDNIRRTTTAVAELAFRCLQHERDMRPSMDEVLTTLKAIGNQEFVTQKAEVVDIRSDDTALLKNLPPPLSPDSVVNDKWVSSSPTPSSN
ncbi:putative serine/threonine-protein kinase [Morus notabilis]|uniref:non-specific serine/threonine protein kinase n=1 Tax=Morus notabilis TaxID=981085 RepID=W9SBG3_9ROSA|nr:LEAF RUST 10 DISEASE-RESISTANCE LOCUS RECEPTOR-LIKE PROTEIN KINASE-like 1.4 isoform X2 [Morus notabilis]EXC20517.1 putative serine/threonine-protein kinase [Morus notabilis]